MSMDPETERHFAALIMEEAARLRLQAEKEGVHAYLAKPKVREKPNPQFLKATVRSIAQANRAAEVNGMWKRRARELELEESERKSSRGRHKRHYSSKDLEPVSHIKGNACKLVDGHRELMPSLRSENHREAECLSSGSPTDVPHHDAEDSLQEFVDNIEDQGLEEEEMERFLHSRVKRGRGAVGSRMDETGPYLSRGCKENSDVRVKEEWEQRILGPSKEVYEMQLVLESKKRRKCKIKADRPQSSQCGLRHKEKGKKKEHKKKHRNSHKKSKKGNA